MKSLELEICKFREIAGGQIKDVVRPRQKNIKSSKLIMENNANRILQPAKYH